MSIGNKLLQKLQRRAKNVYNNVDSDYKRYHKVDKIDGMIFGSPALYKVFRGIARRFDSDLGRDHFAAKPLSALNMNVTTLERFDFDLGAGTDYGMRLTLPADIITFVGFRAGDVIQVLEGELEGYYLAVVSVPDSTHVRLEDMASYVGPEANVVVRFEVTNNKQSHV